MKNTSKTIVALLAIGLVSLSAFAGPTGELCSHRLAKGVPVVVGEWHAGLDETRRFAEENGLPLVAVWSNGDNCGHCTKFENDVNSDAFREYMKNSGVVFFFAHSGDPKPDGPEGGETHKWCSKGWAVNGYPYVRFYWKKGGKLLVDKAVNGDKADGSKGRYTGSKNVKKPGYPDFVNDGALDYDTYNPGGRYTAWFMTNDVSGVFKDYTPAPVYMYAGGVFAASSLTITNGVNKSVNLQLEREDKVKGLIATNWFAYTLSGVSVTNSSPIVWGEGEQSKTYSYNFSSEVDYGVTNEYLVSLLDEKMNVQSSLKITAVPNLYNGCDFNVGSHEHDSLAVVAGKNSYVDVPLIRKSAATVSSNALIIAYQAVSDGTMFTVCETNEVGFAVGESSKMVRIPLPADAGGTNVVAGQILMTLTYLDGDRVAERAKISVQALEEDLPNSSTNPYWLGERTAQTLDWGEWTMDLEAAQQKVATADGAAYTLILVGGSKWCPDCVNVDRWLLDQPQFSAWARARKVICVTVDLPRVGLSQDGSKTELSAYPSLLTYESDKVSDRYVRASEDGEAARYQSGASYLSRHAVPITGNGGTNAIAVAERNARLFLTGTDEGGLCRPDCLDVGNEQTMQFKTGIPSLIVMDKTSRIIGRNFQFNNESPESFNECYISRMDELLAQETDLSEESNDGYLTTCDVLPLRGNTGVDEDMKTISYNDVNDWYRVSPNAANTKCVYTLNGDVEAEVQLRVVQLTSSGRLDELARVKGSLKDGLTAVIEKVPTNACYVCVSAPLTSSKWGVTYGYFALTNLASTVASYVLSSDMVLCPAEVAQSFTVTPGDSMSVTVEVEEGKNYRFSGEGVISDNRVTYNAEGNYYIANETCRLSVPLAETTLTYQIWNPGLIGFAQVTGRVKEPSSDGQVVIHKFRVERAGGTSGIAKVRVVVDQSRSTQLDDIYVFKDDGKILTWAEGDSDPQELSVEILSNTFADGDQRVTFVLECASDSDVSVGVANEYALTIADDADPSIPGKVEICSTVPVKAGSIVYAKSGSDVAIGLDRVEGANGTVGCKLKTTAGLLDNDSFTWGSRDVSVKTATLSLAGVAAGRTLSVTMTPDKGTKAVTSSRSFTVITVADDAPEFATSEVTYTVFRNVDMTVDPIGVETESSAVSVAKCAGQLPGGVKASYDADLKSLVFKGLPTGRPGVYNAVYRVTAGGVKGLVVSVKFIVVDPVSTATESGVPMNEACAKSRTFSDLQVFDTADCSRLIGMMTLTIPPSGRLSAKYVSASGTVSLVSKNWSSVQSTGALVARLTGSSARTSDYQMTVTAFADGGISCYFRDPSYHSGELLILEPGADWKMMDGGASDWQGYYTASMAQKEAVSGDSRAMGDGYITFKMNTASAIGKGKMSYAGMLPNGHGFSGSRTLWGYYDEELKKTLMAYIPVFATSVSDDVSGLVLIAPGASTEEPGCRGRSIYSDKNTYELFDTNKFVWVCKEGVKSDFGYETEFDVHGGFYSSGDDFAGICSKKFQDTTLTFFALTEKCPLPLAAWSTNDVAVSVKPVSKKNSIKLITAKNSQNLTLSFALSTGIVSGTMSFRDASGAAVKATYKGIVMPGWGSASCAECSWQSETDERPFVSGACWFDKGFRYGCPFSIGIEPGR